MMMLDKLTPRQREVVELLAEGHNLGSVAVHLNITRLTVKKHMKDIDERVGEGTVQGLVVRYYQENWEPKHEKTGSSKN